MAQKLLELKTIRPDRGAFDAIEEAIKAFFKSEIYLPLIAELGPRRKEVRLNSMADLVAAFARGRIEWIDGYVMGKLDPVISRELRDLGAIWDARSKRWKLPSDKLTPDIKMALGEATSKFKGMAREIDKRLEALSPEALRGKIKVARIFDATIFRMDRRFSESVKNITVKPVLTEAERAQITERYTLDLDRWIQDWSKKEIVELREKVQAETMSGARFGGLTKILERSWDQTATHAKFLARQETNLFLSEFKRTQYQRAGLNEYRWKIMEGAPLSGPHAVRPDHKKLNNTIQRWDSPPVTNVRTQARNHPGCDFGCRCYDKPVVRF